MSMRKIKKITKGVKAVDGAGVHLIRVVGYHDTKDYDPFLLLDAFDSINPEDYVKGFPWHPHRGIETITYLINGMIEHGDNIGNKGIINSGDCQWMTAGSGIIHQEMPKPSDRMLGVQLWLNMPAEHKMAQPGYGDINAKDVPIIEEEAAVIRLIAGSYKGKSGAFTGKYVQADYLDVEISADSEWVYETKADLTLFIYVLTGEGYVSGSPEEKLSSKNAILFSEGSSLRVTATEEGMRFLLFSAKPLREPIAWGGPIVMNTEEELEEAFSELREGTFIK